MRLPSLPALARLVGRRAQPAAGEATAGEAPAPAIPPGQRVYAIGDVHGRADLLQRLLMQVAEDDADRADAETRIVLLGDLVDRGPDSAGVVALAMALVADGLVTVLKGNHEEVLLEALDGDAQALRLLLRIGGRATLESYGLSSERLNATEDLDEGLDLVRACVPAAHRDFLAGLPDRLAVGDYLFVHAGIRPGVAVDAQQPSDLRWIREPFLGHAHAHPHVVVHGHSIATEPELRANRVGIDTGAYATGRLTALGLEGEARWLLRT